MDDVQLKWLPVISHDVCNGCNKCILVCKPQGLTMANGVAVLINASICLSDGDCVANCPTGALHMEWVDFQGELGQGNSVCIRTISSGADV